MIIVSCRDSMHLSMYHRYIVIAKECKHGGTFFRVEDKNGKKRFFHEILFLTKAANDEQRN